MARRYVNGLSKLPFSGRSTSVARFYCSSSISKPAQQLSAAQLQVSAVAAPAPPVSDKAATIWANVIAASFSVLIFYGFSYQHFDLTKPSEIRKRAEKRVMKNFNRELNSFDAKLCTSGGDDEKLMMYERFVYSRFKSDIFLHKFLVISDALSLLKVVKKAH